MKEGSKYWVYGTNDGITTHYATSLTGTWTQGKPVFSSIPSWCVSSLGVAASTIGLWAPELYYYKSTYYLFYSCAGASYGNAAIGWATNPTLDQSSSSYKWTDHGVIIKPNPNSYTSYNPIDPAPFVDPATGKFWLFWGSFSEGIMASQLSTSTMKPTGTVYNVANQGSYKLTNNVEGASVIYNGGYYYLFVSLDKCCAGVDSTYKIAGGRATKPQGPYYDKSGRVVGSAYGAWIFYDLGDSERIGPGGQSIYGTTIINHYYPKSTSGWPAKFQTRGICFSGGWASIC
ncbi:hypothetical protein HK096_002000 [Nowakowskiella sp. JEL0078]|nr:hypothetical protein HK096_002000 [Nowakowskiella sp. JEL0078]